ncbi:MAG: hypothetical protein IIV10_00520 [Alistipes sp.]|nr:hypothetical protein [Alistipes sp.]
MKTLKTLLWVIATILVAVSCKKEENFSLSFQQTGYYFKWGGNSVTVNYTSTNVARVELKNITDKWNCEINHAARTIIVTPPADPGTEEERNELRTGTLSLNVISNKGNNSTYALTLYIIGDKEILLTDGNKYANCYVATEPVTVYTLDVLHNGGGEQLSGVENVKILWQSDNTPIENLSYSKEDGTATFFIDCAKDEDGEEDLLENGERVVPEGNSVLAAYNAAGEIIWSWHIWVVKSADNPLTDHSTYSNGVTFMNKNLGAFANHNGYSEDTDLIHRSYGLYYQWGRKDPFPRPYAYNCSGGNEERLYNASGSSTYTNIAETSATVGNVDYATKNPMIYITNAASMGENGDGVGDWMSSSNSNLWNDAEKSEYDPCPYGWRVPRSSDFDVLSLSAEEDTTDLDAARNRYGWTLTDANGNTYFYLGGGFRSYYNGKIVNMNHKGDALYPAPAPWEGYYWTSGVSADGKQSTCMYFDLTTTRSQTINKFHKNYPSKRSNGMQIRCVKEQ